MLSVATPEQVVLGEATSAWHPQGPTGDLGPFHRVQQAEGARIPVSQSINRVSTLLCRSLAPTKTEWLLVVLVQHLALLQAKKICPDKASLLLKKI